MITAALLLALLSSARAELTGCSAERPCANKGVCHTLSGACKCMHGFGGSMCETMLHPACRFTEKDNAQGTQRIYMILLKFNYFLIK